MLYFPSSLAVHQWSVNFSNTLHSLCFRLFRRFPNCARCSHPKGSFECYLLISQLQLLILSSLTMRCFSYHGDVVHSTSYKSAVGFEYVHVGLYHFFHSLRLCCVYILKSDPSANSRQMVQTILLLRIFSAQLLSHCDLLLLLSSFEAIISCNS